MCYNYAMTEEEDFKDRHSGAESRDFGAFGREEMT